MKPVSHWILLFIFSMSFLGLHAQTHLDQKAFKKSYQVYHKLKKKHQNSYRLELSQISVFGWSATTTIVVKDGKVVARSYKENHMSPPKNWKPSKWKEKDDQVGTHRDGVKPITLDEIYNYARGYLPAKKLKENTPEVNALSLGRKVYFSTEHQGLISQIGHVPNGCMDDCFNGYRIKSIEWLGNR